MPTKILIALFLVVATLAAIAVGAYRLGKSSVEPPAPQITTVHDTVRVDSVVARTHVITRTTTVNVGDPDLEHLADSLLALTDALLFDMQQIEDLRAEADTTIDATRLLLGYSYRSRAFDVEILREHADTTTTLPVVTECSSGWWKYAVGGAVGMIVALVFAIAM